MSARRSFSASSTFAECAADSLRRWRYIDPR
jgi:hypothetical protein